MLQTIGRTGPATFLAMARQGTSSTPLIWLSLPFGLRIQMAQRWGLVDVFHAAVPLYSTLSYVVNVPARSAAREIDLSDTSKKPGVHLAHGPSYFPQKSLATSTMCSALRPNC